MNRINTKDLVVIQYRFSIFFFAILLFFGLSFRESVAQDSPDTLRATLNPVQVNSIRSSVTPSQAPVSLSTISRSSIDRNSLPALTLDQITGQLPGIWVNDRENYALGERITIRGVGWRADFGVRGIQVIMDDIPLTVADGQAMLNSVDPSFVSNVELIRGPASTFWGNSSGGVLYMSTLSGDDLPSLKVRSMAGSYNTFKEDVQFSQSFGKHKISGYTSYLSSNGYRDHSAVKLSRTGLKGSIDLNPKSRLEYMGAFVAMPQAEHPSGLTASQVDEDPRQANTLFESLNAGKQVYQGQLGLNYYRDASIGFITLTGYGIYRDLNNPLPFGIITIGRWAGGLRGTLEHQFDNLTLDAGVDSKFQFDNRTEYENDNQSKGAVTVDQLETVTNQALFVTGTLHLGAANILGGLRYDWITFTSDAKVTDQSGNRTFTALSPSLGLSYSLDKIKLYSNLSTSFEAPTTTELVNRPDGGNGFNPELKPEHTVGFEIGSRASLLENRLFLDVALYKLWINDLLFPYQLQENGATFYRNQGKTTHQGVEGHLSFKFHRHFTAALTYNYIRARFQQAQTLDGTSLNNNDIPGIPSHHFGMDAKYQNNWLLFDVSFQQINSYPVNNMNTAINTSYSLLDSRISIFKYTMDHSVRFQPFFNVNNILNSSYNGSVVINASGDKYYEPAAGRNWQIGVSIEWL